MTRCLLAFLPGAMACFGQPAGPVIAAARVTALPRADLRVDVPLVLVPVNVTTRIGEPVTNLKQENFRLLEDNIEQNIKTFSSEDTPVSIGLLFDISGSMGNKIRKASEAAIELLKTANPEDEFFLIEFSDKAKLVLPFTRDADDVRRELARARPHGQTALLDAIHLAVTQMKDARHLRKALIIVSDGGDNHSRYHEAQIKEDMLEGDVQVYAMGIFDIDSHRLSREEQDGPRLLGELAAETGGRHFPVGSLDALPSVCEQIGESLRSVYLLGYSPTNGERDGKYRHLKVTLIRPEEAAALRIRNRPGYHAPSE